MPIFYLYCVHISLYYPLIYCLPFTAYQHVHKNTETQDTRTHVDCIFKHLASKRDGTVNADAVVIHTAALGRSIKSHSQLKIPWHIFFTFIISKAVRIMLNFLTSVISEA